MKKQRNWDWSKILSGFVFVSLLVSAVFVAIAWRWRLPNHTAAILNGSKVIMFSCLCSASLAWW